MKIDQISEVALAHQAADLFLHEGEPPYARIGGRLLQIGDEPLSRVDLVQLWTACQSDPVDGWDRDASWTNSQGHRFRINLFRHLGKLGAALRPIKTQVPALDGLGVPSARLQDWAGRSSGIVLVTGATGSGKSTTLASILDWLNQTTSQHLVTIEDPIEYLLTPVQCVITQREVGTDTVSFATGLRSALRQSPDVILLGEIRDGETAQIALQAAETGHLVLSTLHCSDVAETMERLVALFPPQEREAALAVLSKQLIGILCQSLIRSTVGGLHLVVEHLECSGAVRKWIREGETRRVQEFLERGQGDNVRFLDSILSAVQSGLVDDEVARAACPDPRSFDRYRAGIRSAFN